MSNKLNNKVAPKVLPKVLAKIEAKIRQKLHKFNNNKFITKVLPAYTYRKVSSENSPKNTFFFVRVIFFQGMEGSSKTALSAGKIWKFLKLASNSELYDQLTRILYAFSDRFPKFVWSFGTFLKREKKEIREKYCPVCKIIWPAHSIKSTFLANLLGTYAIKFAFFATNVFQKLPKRCFW